MKKKKYGFIASLLAVVGLLAGSAHAATYTTVTDLGGNSVEVSGVSDLKDVFANDSGIKNGTLKLTFASAKWATFKGLSVLIQDATLNLIKCAKDGNTQSAELNIVNGSVVTIDGGKLTSDNNRTSNGNNIGNDNGVGTMRIINGGSFESPNIRVQIGSQTKSGGDATVGILSVDKGTVKIGGDNATQQLTVGGNRTSPEGVATGIVAMTNGVLSAQSIMLGDGIDGHTAQLTFKDSDLTVRTIYRNKKITEASSFVFDGTTVNTAVASQNILADLGFAYQLEGNGVTVNTKHSGTTVGGAFVGNGPFIKKGAETLTFKGKFTDSADLRVEEGTLAFSGATLPDADKIDLAISGTGAFEGLGQSETYKSLALGEDAVLPVAFENGVATTFKAAETIVTATADHPVVIAGTGTLTANTVVAEGLTVTDASIFTLSGVAGSLKIEGGKLIAVKPFRPVDTLTWAKGSVGDNWSGTDNWTHGDPAAATTFQNGDTAVFATAGDKAVVDADVTAAKVEFTADATVTGTATLSTANITVGADVTATIAAPLSEDIEKTGEGELVLRDYARGKALDLKGGALTLAWSETAGNDPFSTAKDANAIAGVLDLGGATQTFAGALADENGIFRDGGEIRNVELTIDPTGWFRLHNVSFTIGKDANVTVKKYTDSKGQLNLYNSYLKIDGGSLTVLNGRDLSNAGAYIGNNGDATIEILNGGKFSHPNKRVILGYGNDGKGAGSLIGDHATVDLGEQALHLGNRNGSASCLALTNSALTCSSITLGFEGTPGKQTVEFVGGTTVKVAGFKKNAVHAESSILFDGATLVPTAAGDLLPNLGVPTTIGASGLVISNDFDVTFAAPLAGEGKLTKKGTCKLTLSGASTITGGIEVQEGDIAFVKGATLPEGVLAVVDGTTVTVNYSADGFAGTPNLTLSVSAEGKVHVEIDASQLPEGGKAYKLFDKIEGGTADNLTITDGYGIEIGEDGSVTVKLSPRTHTWDGGGSDANWNTAENWDTDKCPVIADSIIFNEGGAETIFDLANGLALANIEVNAGAWTTKVDSVCFAGVPIKVKAGALFALTDANGKSNPFSTVKDANVIAGVLDLGGATQTFAGALADENGIFRNGGELRNTTMTVDPTGWFRLHNVSFTIGKDAKVTVNKYENSSGQINFYNTHLVIDGGELNALNARKGDDYGGYVGNDGDAVIEVLNGGKLYHPNKPMILGYANDADGRGTLIADNGSTLDFGSQNLVLGYKNGVGSESCLAMTNSTLVCNYLQLGFKEDYAAGAQTIILAGGTTATIAGFNAVKVNDGASITFDNATIVHSGTNVQILPDLNEGRIPYTIAAGGLTIKVENIKDDKTSLTLPGAFAGEGGITLVAAGNNPKSVGFTGQGVKGFTGDLVASNKITVVADGKTFKGGLCACEGSTLNVATSVFDGNVTIEAGVKFVGLDAEQDYENPVTLLQTKGTITSPLLDNKDPTTKNRYFVRPRLGVNILCYGRKPGTMIVIR